MEEIFGLSMNVLMMAVLAVFLAAMAVVAVLAGRNRIMLKMGLRPIPRRLGQTVLIIIGVMLSTVIISAAFGTGDTLSFSIRSEVLEGLKAIDELVIPARAKADDSFGSSPYVSYQRFEDLQAALADFVEIDGLMPQIGESVPAVNPRTSQSEGSMRVAGVAPELSPDLLQLGRAGGAHRMALGLEAARHVDGPVALPGCETLRRGEGPPRHHQHG